MDYLYLSNTKFIAAPSEKNERIVVKCRYKCVYHCFRGDLWTLYNILEMTVIHMTFAFSDAADRFSRHSDVWIHCQGLARFARHPLVFASLADVLTDRCCQRRAQRTLVDGERSEPVPTPRESLTHQARFARHPRVSASLADVLTDRYCQ